MKTNELYLRILENVRYQVLKSDCKLCDFEGNDDAYDLLCQVNDACNILSSLIEVMRYEK